MPVNLDDRILILAGLFMIRAAPDGSVSGSLTDDWNLLQIEIVERDERRTKARFVFGYETGFRYSIDVTCSSTRWFRRRTKARLWANTASVNILSELDTKGWYGANGVDRRHS